MGLKVDIGAVVLIAGAAEADATGAALAVVSALAVLWAVAVGSTWGAAVDVTSGSALPRGRAALFAGSSEDTLRPSTKPSVSRAASTRHANAKSAGHLR